jgi:hypothetical protein
VRSLRVASAILFSVTVAAIAAEALASSDRGSAGPSRRLNGLTLPDAKVTVSYPFNWYVTTRRLDYVSDPHTLLAVASYVIPLRAGASCDGTQGRGRPANGAFILLKEVLDHSSLRRSLPRLEQRPTRFKVPSGGRAGCLPPYSSVFQFRVASRAFYVFVSVGPRATKATRAAVARVLDTMKIAATR